jgi:hypothetical protein
MAAGSVRRVAAAALATIVVAAAGCAKGTDSSTDLDAGLCDAPMMLCSGNCIDPEADQDNCGKCGKSCSPGTVCAAGKCTFPCPANEQPCSSGDSGPQFCVNLKTDNAHCGRCSTACGSGQFCVNGACSNACVQGQTKCTSGAGTPYCANVQTDGANCGTCGNACPSQQVCAGGVCNSTCTPDQTMCTPDAGGAAYCANVQTDNTNCGNCGKRCGVLESCVNGACVNACAPNQTKCSVDAGQPYCANTQTDASNCGSCGSVCPQSMPVCYGGQCSSASGCLQGGLNPPLPCTTGNDPQTNAPWVVCTADCNQIWISANTGGTYHATEICNNLGYSTLAQHGGTCGHVCSYCQAGSCSSPGLKQFDNGGLSCGVDQWGQKLCTTVIWTCTL